MSRRFAWLLVLSSLGACGGGTTPSDGGLDAARDAASDLAVPDGAVDGSCSTDADGDGHRSTACGGDDCDDTDPNRYPGNTEVCDAANRDEDCDSRTFGVRDGDADGHADSLCCNGSGADMHCGDDCDDTAPPVHPSAAEICDGVDDDCNGMVDDVMSSVYLDCDGDGFGADASGARGCPHAIAAGDCATPAASAGWIAMPGDCDDAHPATHPGATELCNTVDDDCNAVTDEGCACTTGLTRACGTDVGSCTVGTQSCISGHWETGCSGVGMSPEVCNGADDDCDGTVDDGVTIPCYVDADHDGYRTSTVAMNACSCPSGTLPASALMDCCDGDAMAHPGTTAFHTTPRAGCGGFDYDCSGGEEKDSSTPSDTAGNVFERSGTTRACPGAAGAMFPTCPCLAGVVWDCSNSSWACPRSAPPFSSPSVCGATYHTASCPGTGDACTIGPGSCAAPGPAMMLTVACR